MSLSSVDIGVPVNPINEALGDGVAHVLGVAIDVLTGLGVESGLKPVLAAMGFVAYHHNVGPLAQGRVLPPRQ